MAYQHILDNRTHTVADYLRKNLQSAKTFRLVSAYFSIYGYREVEAALETVDEVRFLFGDPTSVEDVDPGSVEPKSYEVTEKGLNPKYELQQRFLAERCAEWVSRDKVRIRSVEQASFLHGKLYLTSPPIRSLVGSSNFTQRGLGASTRANIEINLASGDAEVYAELREWFDSVWSDAKLTIDAKQQVLDALGRIAREHAPELIYYKTLYELFREDIEARLAQESRIGAVSLGDTSIWNALYKFQKDGARSVILKLRRHNGCILADSVGLGKTYTALAVIKHYELCNARVLVLCPRKLRENWSLYQAHTGHKANPFIDDRFAYSLLSHTDLSRDSGEAGGIDLANFHWQYYDLIVIDESHNFRNHEGKRYKRLGVVDV